MTNLPDGPASSTDLAWSVVIPIKGGNAAKTRLTDMAESARKLLADAMALDVVAAVLECSQVARVVVVTGANDIAMAASELGADVITDPKHGLNAAIAAAELAAPWAAVVGDLPALTADVLDDVLIAASQWETSFVPDAAGSGTTMVASLAPAHTHFGVDSAARHRAAGYHELREAPVGVRSDVDTLPALYVAAESGLGPRTRAAIADLLES